MNFGTIDFAGENIRAPQRQRVSVIVVRKCSETERSKDWFEGFIMKYIIY